MVPLGMHGFKKSAYNQEKLAYVCTRNAKSNYILERYVLITSCNITVAEYYREYKIMKVSKNHPTSNE